MNLEKIRSKKSLKLLFLLFTSLLIGAVSAQIYSYMYIQGSGSITTGGLSWTKGVNAPSGATVVGYTVTNMNFSIPKNTFRNFTDSLQLVNNDATSHTFGLQANVTAGDTAKFTSFDLAVYTSAGARIAKISVKGEGSATGLTISGLQTLYLRFEIDPLTDASSGYMAFTLKLTYE